MNQITCIITDDETMAVEGLRRYVEKIGFLHLIGVCEDAMQLNSMLQREKPDLLFLDIEMPYISGIDLLSSMTNPPHVIITSAYEKYAIQGFDLQVDDYLLKPISFQRFLKAANKVLDAMQKDSHASPILFVRSDKQLHRINLDEVMFIEGLENYVVLHFPNRKLTVRSTLRHILDELPSNRFLQVHRSFVVNIDKIELLEGNTLTVADKHIPIARSFRNNVISRIAKHVL